MENEKAKNQKEKEDKMKNKEKEQKKKNQKEAMEETKEIGMEREGRNQSVKGECQAGKKRRRREGENGDIKRKMGWTGQWKVGNGSKKLESINEGSEIQTWDEWKDGKKIGRRERRYTERDGGGLDNGRRDEGTKNWKT